MTQPFFTIITATFDQRPKSLTRAVTSIQNQTYQDYEHILAFQDYSFLTFNDYKINPLICKNCTEWGNKQKNDALKIAKGKWIIFLDDDNILHPNALACLHQLSQKHPKAKVIYSAIDYNGARILRPNNLRCGHVDLLNWCIQTELAKTENYPLLGRAADFNYFKKLATRQPIIINNDTIIGVHGLPIG